MNEQNLHFRVEGGCSRGSLSNGDIIAITGIFASIVAAIFGVWLLEKLQRISSESTEGLEANIIQGSSSHEPCLASVLPRQDLRPSPKQPAQIPQTLMMMMAISTPEVNGFPPYPRELLDHPLEVGINRPERASTWTAGRTKH